MMDKENGCNREGILPFLGRIFIGLVFLLGALGKMVAFDDRVAYLQQAGIHGGAAVYIAIAMVFEIIGALLLFFGWYTRIASCVLILFLLPVTFILHAFWNFQGMEGEMQMANFFKNVAILGGLLFVLCYGPGRWSIDACCCKSRKCCGSSCGSK